MNNCQTSQYRTPVNEIDLNLDRFSALSAEERLRVVDEMWNFALAYGNREGHRCYLAMRFLDDDGNWSKEDGVSSELEATLQGTETNPVASPPRLLEK